MKLTVTNLFYELLTLSYLPNVSDGVGETVREIEKPGWQPMSSISLQQSFQMWHFWSQKHALCQQLSGSDDTQHPE